MSTSMVPVNSLALQYPPEKFRFASTADLIDPEKPVGQDRAIEALKFGTEIPSSGYNIYAMGPPGIGKHQIVEQLLKRRAGASSAPLDWVYVNNFFDSGKPVSISFPAGQAKVFQKQIKQLIDDLRTIIPSLYESERYRTQRDNLIKEFKDQQDAMLLNLQERAKKENLHLLNIHGGLLFAQADKDGNLLDDAALAQLAKTEQDEITQRVNRFNEELSTVLNQIPVQERKMRSRIKELGTGMISFAVESLIKEIREKFPDNKKVAEYLQNMFHDIIENARNFRRPQDEQPEFQGEFPSPTKRYEVNVLIDHSQQAGAPVIYEDNPTFMNLVGQIEHLSQLGALLTDFTLIKAGSLHRANGGYLILDAHRLLTSPYAWEGLKRALKSECIQIESLGQIYSLISTVTLKPDPIPFSCKIVLIGDREIYNLLVQYDPDFSDLFRVSADFESEMPRTPEMEMQFAELLGSLIRKNNLSHMDPSGVARMLEYSTRLSADSERLSISLGLTSNILREADFFTKEAQKKYISASEVQKAIESQVYRASRIYEKILDETERGTLLIDVKGQRVGQINGLSVFEVGNHLFGHPTRITAVVRMGEGSLIDIERETKLGGPLHSKGVLILSGFLKSRYATDVPFSISASLVFEQSYGPVEGDSASLAELASLISALANCPITQGLAVTGSVNQHGEIQAIGAVNEKIECFFDLCKRKGLTGEQGAIIPKANVKHLSLRKDIIESVQRGQFRIYSCETVDDCLELLTGTSAKTLTTQIEMRLRTFAKLMKKSKGIPPKNPPAIEDQAHS